MRIATLLADSTDTAAYFDRQLIRRKLPSAQISIHLRGDVMQTPAGASSTSSRDGKCRAGRMKMRRYCRVAQDLLNI